MLAGSQRLMVPTRNDTTSPDAASVNVRTVGGVIEQLPEKTTFPFGQMAVADKPTLVENMLLLRKEDFDDLLDRAAERGAERCLVHLGLENGSAAKDIRDLRDLLEAWRDARRTAWQTVIRVATTGILALLLVGAAIKFKLMGAAQ